MGRPRKQFSSTKIEVLVSPTLVEYLDELVKMEGFGDSRAEVVRNFVWDRVNQLIGARRLRIATESKGNESQ